MKTTDDGHDSDQAGNPLHLTRRGLLESAGLAFAAAAFAPEGALGALSRMTAVDAIHRGPDVRRGFGPVMNTLSTYMSEAKDRPLPPLALERAEHHTLDTIAAMISGSPLIPGRAALKFAREYGGSAVATIPTTTLLRGPIEAALVNGVLAHADETDDSWPNGWHPGCAVVPAALAVGEQFGISGSHFLRAVALGYDIGARMLVAQRTAAPQTHKSTHSIAGVWGAGAAAGCAASLNPQQMRWVCDYTAQQTSGIAVHYRDMEHTEKAFAFGGMPARSGATSALLVHSGWTGVDDVFTGDNNYFLANARGVDPDKMPLELLIEQLGVRYEVARTNLKKWSVGSPLQPPLDALEIILKKHSFNADDVKDVIVRGNPGGFTDWATMPDINLRHMIAVLLMDKTVTFESSHDVPRLQDPTILRHKAKVRFAQGTGPAEGGQQPLVQVFLADGRTFGEEVKAEMVRGRIDNPMPRTEVVAKSRHLMTPILGAATTARLIDTMLALQNVKDIRELRPLLQLT